MFYYLQPENLTNFDQIETKLTSEMEQEKPYIFAGFGLPTRSCLFCFHNYDDIFLTEGCREKHLALIIRDKIRRA